MRFLEHTESGYRIYAGALEGPRGDGYIAALVVRNISAGLRAGARDTFRDDSLSCGHRWPTAEAALAFAMARGLDVVRKEIRLVGQPAPTALPERKDGLLHTDEVQHSPAVVMAARSVPPRSQPAGVHHLGAQERQCHLFSAPSHHDRPNRNRPRRQRALQLPGHA